MGKRPRTNLKFRPRCGQASLADRLRMKRFGSDSFSIKSARLIANGTKASGHAMPKQINNLSDIPNIAGNSGFHRRGNTQGFTNPAEVIVHEVKRDRMFEVFELLGKGVCEARKPPHSHSHR